MVVGLGCMLVSFLESRLVIGQGFVTRFVCLLGCVRVVSAVPASPLVMIARHRSESIILVSEGWGVGGSVGQTSYVFWLSCGQLGHLMKKMGQIARRTSQKLQWVSDPLWEWQ